MERYLSVRAVREAALRRELLSASIPLSRRAVPPRHPNVRDSAFDAPVGSCGDPLVSVMLAPVLAGPGRAGQHLGRRWPPPVSLQVNVDAEKYGGRQNT